MRKARRSWVDALAAALRWRLRWPCLVTPLLFSGLTTTFLKEFVFGLWLTSPLLLTLAAIVTLIGQIVGRKEGWSAFDSLYWSFITATTVGYGDVRPERKTSKVLSVAIAFVGLTFTGIMVALAVHSATIALAAHDAATKSH